MKLLAERLILKGPYSSSNAEMEKGEDKHEFDLSLCWAPSSSTAFVSTSFSPKLPSMI